MKIDVFNPSGTRHTRDMFTLNDNDTGANPSIDVPFTAQDELDTDDRTQVCFQQSAGGAERFLKFFRFTGSSRLTETPLDGCPVTFPPSASIRAWASSRDIDSSVPVMTNVCPASGCGPLGATFRSPTVRTPASRSRCARVRLRGSSNQVRTDAAITGPISAASCSSSAAAVSIASIDPKWSASTCAPRSPTCRMPRP